MLYTRFPQFLFRVLKVVAVVMLLIGVTAATPSGASRPLTTRLGS